ncbi:hypothetical protein D3C81_1429710 [compost metagenome]
MAYATLTGEHLATLFDLSGCAVGGQYQRAIEQCSGTQADQGECANTRVNVAEHDGATQKILTVLFLPASAAPGFILPASRIGPAARRFVGLRRIIVKLCYTGNSMEPSIHWRIFRRTTAGQADGPEYQRG